jgi:hypothetical protein
VPTGKVLPELLLQVMVGDESTASLAVTVKLTGAPLAPVAAAVIGPGTETVGAVVSRTLTVKVFAADVLPE